MITCILYGLYSAGVGIAFTLIAHFAGWDMMSPFAWYKLLQFPLIPLFIYLAVKERREDEFNGQLTFGQGVLTSVYVGLIAAIVGIGFFLLYITYMNPNFIDQMTKMVTQTMAEHQVPPEKIHERVVRMKENFIPNAVLYGIPLVLILYAFIGCVVAALMKTDEDEGPIRAV